MEAKKETFFKQLTQVGMDVFLTNENRVGLNDDSKISLNTQEDAVLYFLQCIDINMVALILDDNRTYQNFEKPLFIKKLDIALDEFIVAGDTYLNSYRGACNSESCSFKCKGYSFVGNNSNHYFDLIFDVQDGVVNDIFECINFKCNIHGIKKSSLIEIEKSNPPF
jgi:hypothetical protein